MDFRISFTEQAAKDLTSIIEHISDVLYSPGAAEKFYDEVGKRLGKIRENPFIYPLSRDAKLNAEGYRVAVVGNYLMFYLVDEANAIAYIVRIIYGKRDIASVFR